MVLLLFHSYPCPDVCILWFNQSVETISGCVVFIGLVSVIFPWFSMLSLITILAMTLCCAQLLSRVQLFATPWTVAHQAPLSMGILQARILEWVAMPFSRAPSQPRDRTQVSCIEGGFLTVWATRKQVIKVVTPWVMGFQCSTQFLNTCFMPILC